MHGYFGDGTEIVAMVSGTVNFVISVSGKIFILSNVLYASEFTKNIISIARLLTSNGNRVSFDDDVMAISNGKDELKCKQDASNGPSGMFHLAGTVLKTQQHNYNIGST